MFQDFHKNIIVHVKITYFLFLGICVLILTLQSNECWAQKNEKKLSQTEQKRIYDKGVSSFEFYDYSEAFEAFKILVDADSNNALYQFSLGQTIFEGSFDKRAATPHFEKAYSLGIKNEKPQIFYYLGRVYQLDQNFTAAIAAYNTFLPFIQNNKAGKELKMNVNEHIEQCERGRNQVAQGRDKSIKWVQKTNNNVTKYYLDEQNYIRLINLGSEVNSEYSEYGPIFLKDENLFLFTSRRNGTGGERYLDGQFYEDIYVSYLVNDRNDKVENLNNTQVLNNVIKNTKKHDATVSISKDQSQIFFYHNNQIELVSKENGVWQPPLKLSEIIGKTASQVSSASFSPSGNTLIVAGDFKDAIGGKDLYITQKNDEGVWTPLVNMGKILNSKKNEESPFLVSDSVLYFSSEGHSSLGGYDVFVSKRLKNEWQLPQNLQIPINSPADEINYILSYDNDFAYYASNRDGGYGEYDIYKIVKGIDKEIDRDLLAELEANNKKRSIFRGEEIEITLEDEVADNKSKETASSEKSEELSIEEEVISDASSKDDESLADDDKKATHIDEAKETAELDNQVGEDKKVTSAGRPAKEEDIQKALVINDVQFQLGSTALTEAHKIKLNEVVKKMKEDPSYFAQVVGHTDNIGSQEINNKVSRQRALTTYNYLLSKGIDPNRLLYAYAGMNEPIFPNTTAENRAKNRRIEADVFKPQYDQNVFFDFDSHQLNQKAIQDINLAVSVLKAQAIKVIYVVGHTDTLGHPVYNQLLSEKRANAVVAFIKNELPELKIRSVAFGAEKPRIAAKTFSENAANRRVEIIAVE